MLPLGVSGDTPQGTVGTTQHNSKGPNVDTASGKVLFVTLS